MTEEENKLPSQEMNSQTGSEQKSDSPALNQPQEYDQISDKDTVEGKQGSDSEQQHNPENEDQKTDDESSIGNILRKARDRFGSLTKETKRGIGIAFALIILPLIICILFTTHTICFHKWEPATCTEPEICSICGVTQGAATGHDWTVATCTMPMTCKICDEHYGKALGHKVEEWTVELDSTCAEEGVQVGICTVCGGEVSDSIAKKEHIPGDWEIIKEATETSKGERAKKCTVCGEKVESESYTLTAAQLKEKFIQSCKTYSFSDLARNADSLEGQRITAKGKVVQVMKTGDYYEMRINITSKGYGYWTDTVYVTYFKESSSPNIIEDDIITFYGEIEGNTSYQTVLGATVTLPDIAAQYIDIN